MGRKFGFSFSWKRALGISSTKGKISRAIGIPLTQSGRERKVGRIFGDLAATALIASRAPSPPHEDLLPLVGHQPSLLNLGNSGTLLRVGMLNSSIPLVRTRVVGLREESLIKPGVMRWTDNDGIAALTLNGNVYSICESWAWRGSFESLTSRMIIDLSIPADAFWDDGTDGSCLWEYDDTLISLEVEDGIASVFITLRSVAAQVSQL